MQNSKKLIVSILSFIFLGLLVGGYIFWRRKPPLVQLTRAQTFQILSTATKQIKEIFELGDIRGLLEKNPKACSHELGEFSLADHDYLRCNPNFLQCYLEGSLTGNPPSFSVRFEGRNVSVSAAAKFAPLPFFSNRPRYVQLVSKSINGASEFPGTGTLIYLQTPLSEWQLPVILADTCSNRFLPERVYSYSSENTNGLQEGFRRRRKKKNETPDLRWDSFDKKIFIDKYLVTNAQVNYWIIASNEKKISLVKNKEEWAQPATRLNSEEMTKFCAFQSKQVLQAHIFDAATIYPDELSDKRPIYIKKNPYPWTRKNKESFLFNMKRNKNEKLSKEDCAHAYIKGCEKFGPYLRKTQGNSSWIEINEILGGPLEYMVNPMDPKQNLKASSYYFPAQSWWHVLGRRAQWDGQGHLDSNIKWVDEVSFHNHQPFYEPPVPKPENELEIGFRCMRWGSK